MLKYKKLSHYLESLVQKNTQIKSIVYSQHFPFNVASSFSLFSTCLSNLGQFQEFKAAIESSQKVEVTNKYLLFVMLAEYLNTGKIVGGGKIKRVIINNLDKLNVPTKSKIIKPNVQIRVRKGNVLPELDSFQMDQHIDGVFNLSYPEYSALRKDHQEIFVDKVVVQSKSSCLPAWLLFQDLSFRGRVDVIDCCSAPGNKTIQLSQYIGNGRVCAYEKDKVRHAVLAKRVRNYGIGNIKTYNEDFLLSNVNDPKFSRVKLVLADPSCSGSGMLVNFSNNTIDESLGFEEVCNKLYEELPEAQKKRVDNLKAFQLSILHHCAEFQPARISYSTCSIYSKENEEVVEEFLKAHQQYRTKRRPKSIEDLPRGFGEVGFDCVRVSPLDRVTDGFFVCIFKLR